MGKAVDELRKNYGAFHYVSVPHEHTHPDLAYVLARMMGVGATLPSKARILELGCATGGNILAMARDFPESEFVGVDLSEDQIVVANDWVARLGLTNVRFIAASVSDLGAELGQFDYVVAHGLYSWVPPEVQRDVLRLVRATLAPEGIGYVSFNVMPAWHLRKAVREIMQSYTKDVTDPTTKVLKAREILGLLGEHAPKNSIWKTFLIEEARVLAGEADFYLFHEHLEECNEPVYFDAFLDEAAAAGLAYLGDPHLPTTFATEVPEKVTNTLNQVSGSSARFEVYLDYVTRRSFRRAYLTHTGRPKSPDIRISTLPGLFFSHALEERAPLADLHDPESTLDLYDYGGVLKFGSKDPMVKAALRILADHPEGVEFVALVAKAAALLGVEATEERQSLLGRQLVAVWARGGLSLRPRPLACAGTVSQRPQIDEVNHRLLAAGGASIWGRRHFALSLGAIERRVAMLLDGKRTIAEITAEIVNQALRREVWLSDAQGFPLTDPFRQGARAAELVPIILLTFARNGVLVG